MKKIIALAVVLVILLAAFFSFNFEHGSSLANFQDELFTKYESGDKITNQELHRLESNRWVSVARFLAPNNMVIRQYCLIDLAGGEDKNKGKILEVLGKIAPDHIWLEGYSYWLYTKPFLKRYNNDFSVAEIGKFIEDNDSNFVKTAYSRDNKLYPAPFGDLRDIPLEDTLQSGQALVKVSVGVVAKDGNSYSIKAGPLGFNMHTAERGAEVEIVDGQPDNFKFYEGYNKKYKNFFFELVDMMDLRRLIFLIK